MQPSITLLDDGKILVLPPKFPSEEVKEVLGGRAKFDKSNGRKIFQGWVLPLTALNVLTLADWYGEEFVGTAEEEVQDVLRLDWGFPGFEDEENWKVRARSHQHPYWEKLYPFQKIAVEYAVCNPHRGTLLGLSPGLGKTVVTAIVIDVLEAKKILILAPLTLAKNWGKELDKWLYPQRLWKRTVPDDKEPYTEGITITNFETCFYTILRDEDGKVFKPEDDLIHVDPGGEEVHCGKVSNPRAAKKWVQLGPKKENPKTGKLVWARERIVQARPSYAEVDWDLLVVDESILLKNRKAVKIDIIKQLAKYSHQVLLLSGSPTAKFRDDLFPQCQTLSPKAFSAYWRFADFFCVVDRGQWGWNITGDRPDHDPQKYLKDFLLVLNQKDVLPDLPDYIYDPIEIDLNPDQDKAFKQMIEEWVVALDHEGEDFVQEGEEDLAALNRLSQQTRMLQITSNLCNLTKGAGKPMPHSSAKEDLLVDLIRQGDIEFPLLVWTWFVPTTESVDTRLEREFKNLRTTYVAGCLTSDQKDLGIEMYKEGEVDVLVLQMGVGKFGHTFTDTKTVYYHDRTFDSDAYVQSLSRVKRIGLTHRPRLIVPRAEISADPLVELNLAGKMQSISKVASHDLTTLLRSLGSIEWAMQEYNTGLKE